MADITLRLDDMLIERLRRVAQARGCSVEALVAQWVGELPADAGTQDANAGTQDANDAMDAAWNQEEAAFLHDMARALDEVPAGTSQLPGDARTQWDKGT